MNGLESRKDERLRKKLKKQESIDMEDEMIRRLYIGSDSGG